MGPEYPVKLITAISLAAGLQRYQRPGGQEAVLLLLPFTPKCYTMLCFSAVKETILFLRTFSHGDTCSLTHSTVVVVVFESKALLWSVILSFLVPYRCSYIGVLGCICCHSSLSTSGK